MSKQIEFDPALLDDWAEETAAQLVCDLVRGLAGEDDLVISLDSFQETLRNGVERLLIDIGGGNHANTV